MFRTGGDRRSNWSNFRKASKYEHRNKLQAPGWLYGEVCDETDRSGCSGSRVARSMSFMFYTGKTAMTDNKLEGEISDALHHYTQHCVHGQ